MSILWYFLLNMKAIQEADHWSSDMWLHELKYGTEKAALGERAKLDSVRLNLDHGLLGGAVEIVLVWEDEDVQPIVGQLKGYNLAKGVLTVKSEGQRVPVQYAEVETTAENGREILSVNPLIELKTDRPYKF
jgi:hypothetical protein